MAARYEPRVAAARATFASIILGAHLLALAAALSLGGIAIAVRSAPMIVQLLPEAPAGRHPTRTVALPELRPPDIRLPAPPPLENLSFARMEEHPAPPASVAAAVSTNPTPNLAPSIGPPRYDMAYLNNPAPAYPGPSRRAREQGRVLLRVRVDPTGRVEAIELQATSGFARLDEAALAAVRRWRFLPARSGEQAVAGWALVPIHFQLSG